MKKADIIPGAIAAIAAKEVTGYGRPGYRSSTHGVHDVREGQSAAPARIISVGKWRSQRQGACDIVFVEDGHTDMALIEVPDLMRTMPKKWVSENTYGSHQPTRVDLPGMPDGMKLSSKKIVWVRRIISPASLIYPWDLWLKMREERLFAEYEMNEYRKRNGTVLRELGTLLAPIAATLPEGSDYSFSNYDSANYEFKYRVHLDVGALLEAGAFNGTTARVKELYDEHMFLQSKLACRR